MRRFLLVFAVVACCSAPTWADSIEVDVNAWATFTATQPCSYNCTETIGMSFLYVEPTPYSPGQPYFPYGEIVPGTLNVSSSGFLGSFYGGPVFVGFIPFWNSAPFSAGDEIDLDIPSTNEIQTGVNTVDLYLWGCQSQACYNAFGERWTVVGLGNPTSQASLVAPVAVPDETSFLSLALTSLGTVGLVWRWRRSRT